jgi:hypothetical protein
VSTSSRMGPSHYHCTVQRARTKTSCAACETLGSQSLGTGRVHSRHSVLSQACAARWAFSEARRTCSRSTATAGCSRSPQQCRFVQKALIIPPCCAAQGSFAACPHQHLAAACRFCSCTLSVPLRCRLPRRRSLCHCCRAQQKAQRLSACSICSCSDLASSSWLWVGIIWPPCATPTLGGAALLSRPHGPLLLDLHVVVRPARCRPHAAGRAMSMTMTPRAALLR